jgi:hypothetical protein
MWERMVRRATKYARIAAALNYFVQTDAIAAPFAGKTASPIRVLIADTTFTRCFMGNGASAEVKAFPFVIRHRARSAIVNTLTLFAHFSLVAAFVTTLDVLADTSPSHAHAVCLLADVGALAGIWISALTSRIAKRRTTLHRSTNDVAALSTA